MNETRNLNKLMYSVKSAMKDLNYSVSSVKHYSEVWKRYLKSTNCIELDEVEINQFLKDTYRITDDTHIPHPGSETNIICTIDDVNLLYRNSNQQHLAYQLYWKK